MPVIGALRGDALGSMLDREALVKWFLLFRKMISSARNCQQDETLQTICTTTGSLAKLCKINRRFTCASS